MPLTPEKKTSGRVKRTKIIPDILTGSEIIKLKKPTPIPPSSENLEIGDTQKISAKNLVSEKKFMKY
jgi:hypothetical protein